MPIDVLTRSYNQNRTGVNLQETLLKKSNVNVNQFGKLFVRTVDGQIYAQPLIATNILIRGVVYAEVLFVATTRNFVYAFDAKDPVNCDFLWRTGQLGLPAPVSDFDGVPRFPTVPGSPDFPGKERDYKDLTEEVGIVSTPVIDDAKQVIYVVAKSKLGDQYFNKLHKIDLSTGLDVAGSPVLIAGSVRGNGFGSQNGTISFDQKWQMSRPGLLLANGNLYIAFASQGDEGPYHGWVFSYDARTLEQKAIHCTTPNWGEGGIWQSGSGLAFAAGHVYYVAGNGPDSGNNAEVASGRKHVNRQPTDAELSAAPEFGNTIVKLDAETLQLADWFSPTNTRSLSENDQDLCSGPILPEGTNLVLGFGKDGFIYVCDRNSMGRFNPTSNSNIQSEKITAYHVHGTPLYWNGKQALYLWSEQDACLGYRLSGDRFTFIPGAFSRFKFQLGVQQMPGGMLALSANGDQDGILWASHPTDKNANQATVAGTLRALDADDLQNELWNSDHDPQGSDAVGNFAKFCPPVVANGKVYMATFSRGLVVYGLLNDTLTRPLGVWSQASIGTGVLGSASESCDRLILLGSGRDIWDASDAFHFVFQDVSEPGSTVMTALISGVQNTNPWAKAGVMIRDSLDPASPHAMVVMTPGNGVAFQSRAVFGGGSITAGSPSIKVPCWVRIIREPVVGAPGQFRFIGLHSTDGNVWIALGQPVVIAMRQVAKAGLVVCSHTVTTSDPNSIIGLEELNESSFEHVTLRSF